MGEEKPYKSNEEWKSLINEKLKPEEFQHLCREILKSNKFINVRPRGKGSDGKRDIEAELDSFIGKERVNKKCWVQCKKYGPDTALNYNSFSTDVNKAQNNHIEEFLIISNKDLSSNGKTDIQEWNLDKNPCKVRDWTGDIFLEYLFSAPLICKRFFPDEQVPSMIAKDNPKNAIKIIVHFGEQIGIEFDLQTEKEINKNNPYEIGNFLKKILLELSCENSQKILIYQKSSFVFLGLGMEKEAIFFLNKALDLDNENVETLLIKGYILEKVDDLEESNKIYDELLKIDENNMGALNNKGFNFYRKGDLDNALTFIEKSLKIDKSYIPAIKNKIDVLLAKRQMDDALKFLDENSFAFEKSIDLMSRKVNLLLEKLDLKEAFKLNEQILKIDENNLAALNNKGAIYERNARYQFRDKYSTLALRIFEEVIQIDKNYPLGWSNKTVMLINNSRLEEAEQVIDFAYSEFPESPDVVNKKGVLLLVKGEPKKSLRYFDSALKKHYNGEFLLNRASAKLRINHFVEALDDIGKLLKNEPENSKAWVIKGDCLKKLRKPFWQQALENSKKFEEKYISLLEDEKNDKQTKSN